MRKTISVLIAIFLMIGVCGCGMNRKIDRMLAYINDKYADDTFTYVSITGGHLGSNVTKILVSSEKYPGERICVICLEVDGEEIFRDTYLSMKFEDQTYEYIKAALVDAFGENIYLKYMPDDVGGMENGTSDTTFAEFIADPRSFIEIEAAVCSSVASEDEAMETIERIFADAVVKGRIYYIDENVVLSGEDGASNAAEHMRSETYCKRLFFVKETVDEYSVIKWVDGMNSTEQDETEL